MAVCNLCVVLVKYLCSYVSSSCSPWQSSACVGDWLGKIRLSAERGQHVLYAWWHWTDTHQYIWDLSSASFLIKDNYRKVQQWWSQGSSARTANLNDRLNQREQARPVRTVPGTLAFCWDWPGDGNMRPFILVAISELEKKNRIHLHLNVFKQSRCILGNLIKAQKRARVLTWHKHRMQGGDQWEDLQL